MCYHDLKYSKQKPPEPPEPPAIRVINEDKPMSRIPPMPPKRNTRTLEDRLLEVAIKAAADDGNIEEKIDALSDKLDKVIERMDQQFMNLAGLLDKFMESQAPDEVL